jgi:hypothetical protein
MDALMKDILLHVIRKNNLVVLIVAFLLLLLGSTELTIKGLIVVTYPNIYLRIPVLVIGIILTLVAIIALLKESPPATQDKPADLPALSDKEKRILRALFDEQHGRFIYNYRKSYAETLQKLEHVKEWVRCVGDHYYLTKDGLELTKAYLYKRLKEVE